MLWIFLSFTILAITYIKLGAMSVWVSVLLAAFNFMLYLLAGIAVCFVFLFWNRNKLQRIK